MAVTIIDASELFRNVLDPLEKAIQKLYEITEPEILELTGEDSVDAAIVAYLYQKTGGYYTVELVAKDEVRIYTEDAHPFTLDITLKFGVMDQATGITSSGE